MIESSVSGITFCNVPIELWNELHSGVEVTLRREPTNKWDKNAIEVIYKNHRLGYLEKEVSLRLASQMDRGAKAIATVAGRFNTPKDRPVLALSVEVT
jgi:hypothetical protein